MTAETQLTFTTQPGRSAVVVLRLLGTAAGMSGVFLLWGYYLFMTEDVWVKHGPVTPLIATATGFALTCWLFWTAYRSWRPAGLPPVRSVSEGVY